MDPADPHITQLLAGLTARDRADGLTAALPVVYEELRRLSRSLLANERANHTLQPTALVNEAYMRLAGREAPWESRGQFYRTAARVMRHILIDHARERKALKRGGGAKAIPLTDGLAAIGCGDEDLLDLDAALAALTAMDEQKGRVVELRFYGGCSIDETAEALGVSTATVERDWRFARAWLRTKLQES